MFSFQILVITLSHQIKHSIKMLTTFFVLKPIPTCKVMSHPDNTLILSCFAFEHGPHTMLEPSSERILTSSSFLTESSKQYFFFFINGDRLVSSSLLRFEIFWRDTSHCVVNGPMWPMAIMERAARRLFRPCSDSKIRPKHPNIQHSVVTRQQKHLCDLVFFLSCYLEFEATYLTVWSMDRCNRWL